VQCQIGCLDFITSRTQEKKEHDVSDNNDWVSVIKKHSEFSRKGMGQLVNRTNDVPEVTRGFLDGVNERMEEV
jgi:hypothetical protein